ncbi:MAG: poly-gamma-glutamate biosynthesis protein PgsC [Fusobacteriaceae bacterium]|nr:poly-gamma-glutamate biosynthesis protein PgsC [Fusobacteriaceae bacterium]
MYNNIIILGIVLSIFFSELTGISPGGVIVPAYFAIYLDNPKKILVTILVSIFIYFIVKLISNFAIIYGKRKFALCMLLGFVLRYILKSLNIFFISEYDIYFFNDTIIGSIIPGILANDIDKNGLIYPLSSLVILSIFIKSIVEIFI